MRHPERSAPATIRGEAMTNDRGVELAAGLGRPESLVVLNQPVFQEA